MSLQRVAFSPLHTFTRATDETFFNQVVDSFGNVSYELQTAPSGTAVQNAYDPSTGEPLGLQIFEQRTNLLFNSGWLGAVSGTAGTAPTDWTVEFGGGSLTVSDSTILSGAKAIEFSATDARQYISRTTTVAGSSVHTATVECEVLSDGLTIQNLITATGTATPSIVYYVDGVVTPAANAVSIGKHKLKMVVTADADGGLLSFRAGVGTAGNETGVARFELPQLELGSFETPFILTPVGASATRNASVAVINDIDESEWWNPNQWQIKTKFNGRAGSASTSTRVLSIDDGTANNAVFIGVFSNQVFLANVIGGVTTTSTLTGSSPNNTDTEVAVRYDGAALYISVNGGAEQSIAQQPSSLLNRLVFGRTAGVSYFNGHIAKLIYTPSAGA